MNRFLCNQVPFHDGRRTSDPSETFYRKGCEAFLQKRWEAAREDFTKAVNGNLENPDAWLMLALCAVKMGGLANGIIHLRTCLDLKPDHCFALACVDAFNRTMLNHYHSRTGRTLDLYEDEIVYTTEHEADITRGTEYELEKFQRELDKSV